jgi:hypothetical protein
VALCLGWLRVPLPRWLGPRITACESGERDQVHVSVDVQVPLLGRLLAYQGTLTVEEHG